MDMREMGRLFGAMAVAAFACPAFAADLPANTAPPAPVAPAQLAYAPSPLFGFISEARIGVFAHDPWSPESGSGADLNLELLSVRPFQLHDPSWEWVIPRVHVGGTVNFMGRTSHAYAGLAWTYDITQSLFVEGSLGGAVHNGESEPLPHHNAMGCNAVFRESASVGWRITRSWSVMATVEHLSNAGLCDQNRGLTNAGIRVGYTF